MEGSTANGGAPFLAQGTLQQPLQGAEGAALKQVSSPSSSSVAAGGSGGSAGERGKTLKTDNRSPVKDKKQEGSGGGSNRGTVTGEQGSER